MQRAGLAAGAKLVLVFGSVARGEALVGSDLDLLLVLDDDTNLLEAGLKAQGTGIQSTSLFDGFCDAPRT